MAEMKKSGQSSNDAANASTNTQANNDATSAQTLSDIEKREVVPQSDSSTQDEDTGLAAGATPDNQFDSAGEEGTRGKMMAGRCEK